MQQRGDDPMKALQRWAVTRAGFKERLVWLGIGVTFLVLSGASCLSRRRSRAVKSSQCLASANRPLVATPTPARRISRATAWRYTVGGFAFVTFLIGTFVARYGVGPIIRDSSRPILLSAVESGPAEGLAVWFDIRHIDPTAHTASVNLTVALPHELLRQLAMPARSTNVGECPGSTPLVDGAGNISPVLDQANLLLQVFNDNAMPEGPNFTSTTPIPFRSLIPQYSTGEDLPDIAYYRQQLRDYEMLPEIEGEFPIESEELHMGIFARLPEPIVVRSPTCSFASLLPVHLIVEWDWSAAPFEAHVLSLSGGPYPDVVLGIHRQFSQMLTVLSLAFIPLMISIVLLPWLTPNVTATDGNRLAIALGLFAAVVTAPPLRSALVPADVAGFTYVDLLLVLAVACWFAVVLWVLIARQRGAGTPPTDT
jgi:hypothetical protein